MLEVKNLNVFYGKLQILWDLSMQVGDESVGLFGPNGAGKTTLINTILGWSNRSAVRLHWMGSRW